MRNLISPMLLMQLAAAATTPLAANITLDGCERKCGEVNVPYPFGTSYGCHRRGFKVTCDHASSPPKLFLGGDGTGLEMLEISIQNRTVRVRATVWSFAVGNMSDGVFKMSSLQTLSPTCSLPIGTALSSLAVGSRPPHG